MTRILITGGCGFIYSNFTRFVLAHRNWDVVVLDRLDEAGTLERLADLRTPRLRTVWHDLRAPINPDHFNALAQPFDYIVHGAACSHVNRATLRPLEAAYDNVIGTVNLLDYARHYQPQAKVLYVSTDEIFGPAPEGIEFGEHARWEPENPYAAAKAGGEAFCPAYARQYGMRIAVSRCGNCYGPRQYREKFIPLCIERILADEVVQIHARDGVASSRLYIHVDDVCAATLAILEKGGVIAGAASGRYNIVPECEWSNLVVAEKLAALLGKKLRFELVENPPGRPVPDMRYAMRGDKLGVLGWEPRISLDEGLKATVEHYLEAQSSNTVLNSAPANDTRSSEHGRTG